eukprot:82964-Amphidinium_carterae.1
MIIVWLGYIRQAKLFGHSAWEDATMYVSVSSGRPASVVDGHRADSCERMASEVRRAGHRLSRRSLSPRADRNL